LLEFSIPRGNGELFISEPESHAHQLERGEDVPSDNQMNSANRLLVSQAAPKIGPRIEI